MGEDFLALLRAQGAELHPSLRIKEADGERGIFVETSLPESTVLAKLPHGLLLTGDALQENEFLPAEVLRGLGSFPPPLLKDRILFILFLLSPPPALACWTCLLPERARSPLFFSEEELERVRETPLHQAVRAKQRSLMREHALLEEVLAGLDGAPSVSLERFIWADTLFRSRVFGIPALGTSEGEALDGMILLLDFLNHEPGSPKALWKIEQDGIYLVSQRDLVGGDEITVSYGSKGNEELLFQYGFSLPQNRYDQVMLLAPISEQDPFREEKKILLASLGLPPRILIGSDGIAPGQDAFEVARISLAEPEEAELFEERFELDREAAGPERPKAARQAPLTPENEARVVEFLVARLEQYLDSVDKITLADSPNRAFLENYVEGQRATARSALGRIRQLQS